MRFNQQSRPAAPFLLPEGEYPFLPPDSPEGQRINKTRRAQRRNRTVTKEETPDALLPE